jgi:DDE family transposase
MAAVNAGLVGADTFVVIELWAKEKLDWLRGYLQLEHGIPSHDTFGRGDGETVGDEVLHGHDHREGLDLAGNAASSHFGAEVDDFPEAGQYLFAVQVQPAQSLGLLLDELLLHGGAVLEHVGADTGFGFSVGGGVGVEADGFGGMTVGHDAREDQGQRLFPDR